MLPTNVTGQVCYYRDATKPLLQSDMDKLWSVKVEDNILKGNHSRGRLEGEERKGNRGKRGREGV